MPLKKNDATVRLLRIYLFLKITYGINVDLIMNMLIRSIHNDIFKQWLHADADIKKIHKRNEEKRRALRARKKRTKNKYYRRMLARKKRKRRLAKYRRFSEAMARKSKEEREQFIAMLAKKREEYRKARQIEIEQYNAAAKLYNEYVAESNRLYNEIMRIKNKIIANSKEIKIMSLKNKAHLTEFETELNILLEKVEPSTREDIKNNFTSLQKSVNAISNKYLQWQQEELSEEMIALIAKDKEDILSKQNQILHKIKKIHNHEYCLQKANDFIDYFNEYADIAHAKNIENVELSAKENECTEKFLILQKEVEKQSKIMDVKLKSIERFNNLISDYEIEIVEAKSLHKKLSLAENKTKEQIKGKAEEILKINPKPLFQPEKPQSSSTKSEMEGLNNNKTPKFFKPSSFDTKNDKNSVKGNNEQQEKPPIDKAQKQTDRKTQEISNNVADNADDEELIETFKLKK